MPDARMALTRPLPVGSIGRDSSGWWGMWGVIATEGALFAYLLFSYFYIAAQATTPWPPAGAPKLGMASFGTLVLVAASLTVWWGERGIMRGRPGQLRVGLAATLVLGVGFLALQLREWSDKPFTISKDVYGSLFFTITGFHMAHVIVGVLVLSVVFAWSAAGFFSPRRYLPVTIASTYWHFVDVVWLAVFFTFYVTPLLW